MAAVLCSACQLDLQVDVDVDRNGGGVIAVAVAADEELLELAADADADPLGDLVAAGEQLRDGGWRVADSTDGAGGRTVTLSAEFADPAEFEALTQDLAESLAADEVELLEPFSMTVFEDRIAVAGGASAEPRAAVRDYGLTPQEAVRLIKREDAFRYDVVLRLPGELLTADDNGDTPGELRWVVSPGTRTTITAESTRPGPPWIRAALGAVAGAAVAGLVLWLVARRRA